MALKHHSEQKIISRHRWARRWAANCFLVIAATIIALLLGEVGMRLRPGSEISLKGLFRADPEVGVALTPGFEGVKTSSEFEYEVRINDHGIRDHPIVPKPPGVRRVLVLGDSFTFGTGVPLEFSYPKQMEKHLNAAQDRYRYEVVNAVCPAMALFRNLTCCGA